MIEASSFQNVRLPGGFLVAEIEFTTEPMLDALNREAVAQTRIVGREFRLRIRAGLSQRELSISLYHEILEAASIASPHPPTSVMDFNEGDFERAAHSAHATWGDATPENLIRLLQSYGFYGE